MAHSPHRRWKGVCVCCQLCKPYKFKDQGQAARKPWSELRHLRETSAVESPRPRMPMIYVSTKRATFGLIVDGPPYRVTMAPPYAREQQGRLARDVWDYYVCLGAHVRWIG